jgi:hypothetical protein
MILAQGSKGVATITNSATGAFSYVPNANANGSDSFTFRVYDGTTYSNAGTITMTITPVNDIPVWTSSTSITLSATGTTPVNTTLTATDIDGDAITYSILACTGGTCNINATSGVFTFTPNGTAGTYMVSARCYDGTVYCSSNTNITINVASANQAPLAVNSSEKLLVRTGTTTFTLNASDADNNPLTYSIVSPPTSGTLSAVSENSITYTLGAWTSCASEGQSCAITGTKLVKYGSATKFVIYKMTGTFMCDNETLGDPDVGSGKTCSTLPTSDSFVFRANDGTANSNMATVSISYEDWFDKAWSKRKKLVFNNNNAGDVSDAPVLVKLDNLMQANGEDLRFVDEAGNVLSYEIEKWNPSGISYVWVKTTIGGMEPKSHFVWMYYGNMISSAGQNKTDVWSNGYVSVWHFATTTGDVLDSKGVNHGTAQSITSRSYSGPLGNAYSNTNAAACVEIAHHSSQVLTSEYTIEALSRAT